MRRAAYYVVLSVLFLALLAWLSWPWPTHFATHLPAAGPDGDAFLYAYKIDWWADSIRSLRSPFRRIELLGADEPYLPAYDDQTPTASFPGGLLSLLTGPIIAYNIVLAICFIANALAMALLARRFTGSRLAGLFAGAAFSCCPYLMPRYGGHLNLIQLFWLPLAVLAYEHYLAQCRAGSPDPAEVLHGGAMSCAPGSPAGSGDPALQGVSRWIPRGLHPSAFILHASLAAACLCVSSPYYLLLLGPGLLTYLIVRGWREARPSQRNILVAIAVWLAIVVPLAVMPYVGLQRGGWGPSDRAQYAVGLREYLLPVAMQAQLITERRVGPGAVVLVLALVGIVLAPRRHRLALVAMAATLFVLSVGPEPLMRLPGYSGLRCPSRAGVGIVFALVLLAAYAVAALPRLLRPVAVLAVLAELVLIPHGRPIAPVDARANAVETYLAGRSGAIIVMPTEAMISGRVPWGTRYHHRRTYAGLGGSQRSVAMWSYWIRLNKAIHFNDVPAFMAEHGATDVLLYTGHTTESRRTARDVSRAVPGYRIAARCPGWAVLSRDPGNRP